MYATIYLMIETNTNSRKNMKVLIFSFIFIIGVTSILSFYFYKIKKVSTLPGTKGNPISIIDQLKNNQKIIEHQSSGEIIATNIVSQPNDNILFSYTIEINQADGSVINKNYIIYNNFINDIDVYTQSGAKIQYSDLKIGDFISINYIFDGDNMKYDKYEINIR